MRKLTSVFLVGTALVAGCLGSARGAHALALPDPTSYAYQYGDAYSYSLPILANLYDIQYPQSNSNPFDVDSTPGAIKSLSVIGTGVSGSPQTTNFVGMDNAYHTPGGNGGALLFNTSDSEPDEVSAFIGDQHGTWDTTLAALTNFLGTGQVPIFFFNNNQDNGGATIDQNLLIWGQIELRDLDSTNLAARYFDLTNNNGAGGVAGGNVYAYSSPGKANVSYPAEPTALDSEQTDYILSGGQICVNTQGAVVACTDSTAVSPSLNHNLGADHVAYAAIFPELNALLTLPDFGGYDVMSIDLRMRYLNGGYEQIFIGAGEVQTPPVPEPGTIALVGAGLAVVALCARKRRS